MSNSVLAINKKAKFNYELIKEYDAGIVLKGWEVKSLRSKKVVFKDSFIIIKKHEPYIINLHITPDETNKNNFVDLNPTRTRKLLLNKKEINDIEKSIMLEKLIVVPTKIFIKNNHIKIKIFLAKGKRKQDKRQAIKERDIKREISKKYKI